MQNSLVVILAGEVRTMVAGMGEGRMVKEVVAREALVVGVVEFVVEEVDVEAPVTVAALVTVVIVTAVVTVATVVMVVAVVMVAAAMVRLVAAVLVAAMVMVVAVVAVVMGEMVEGLAWNVAVRMVPPVAVLGMVRVEVV
jgi:hypothetical protein